MYINKIEFVSIIMFVLEFFLAAYRIFYTSIASVWTVVDRHTATVTVCPQCQLMCIEKKSLRTSTTIQSEIEIQN